LAIRSLDFGPWTCSGATSASRIVTSRSGYAFLNPRANSSASEDASANQKVFSSIRVRTGSLTIPPSLSQINTYLPCPTAHVERSRGVSSWAKRKPSGPPISRHRSTATSHRVTPVRSVSNSSSNESKRIGKYMWL
jgi:hypothetical protein